ncbi:tRNA-specific adenosine deaminase [candidate division BRC1 bacterium HGW-BRC1-1]|jgi:tRNA(adenine34) deaminase|nr:MAG: tRNA-specific adenosine deaminase [candidate division BRC1 bacterium HGW-BRC1-1]
MTDAPILGPDSPYRNAPLPPSECFDEWMGEALREATDAQTADEVPVGAVVVHDGKVIGRGRDRRVELRDPTAHAEVLAMREAALALGDWRLEGCALFVTLEPCPMCAGAALMARLPLLVYGANNDKFGALITRTHLADTPAWNHRMAHVGGVRAEECAALLKDYFSRKRRGLSA